MQHTTYMITLEVAPNKTQTSMIRSDSLDKAIIIAQYNAIVNNKNFKVVDALTHEEYMTSKELAK